ncbi:hypothetical protein GCM10027569_31570 [Flindersiella endophytica]
MLLAGAFAGATALEAAATQRAAVAGVQGREWTLHNEVVSLRLRFADGSLAVTSLYNRQAGREYQAEDGAAGRPLFAYEFDGRHLVAADDGGWTLLTPTVRELTMRTARGVTRVGREVRIPLRRSEPQPVTVTFVAEVYDGRSGLRFYSLIRNDDSARETTITSSVVFALALEDRPHTLHYVPNMTWQNTTGSLAPTQHSKKALTVYDTGDGWSVSPELNWKTMRGNGNYSTGYMLPPFASVNAWHGIDHVRVTTNPEALQLVLFPNEEFEYVSTNVTVFAGDMIDGKVADQEHFRRRFRYHDVSTIFNTNDWDYRGGPGRPLPEDYYYTTILPKAEQAGFDLVMFDDLWNTTRDTIEPNPAMAGSIRSLDEFTETLTGKGMLFGLWFSLTGAGHAAGRDLADPAQLAYKRAQIETLINSYGLDHHMVDLTEYWQNEQVTTYSHPSDSVYRKNVLTRRMLNELVEKYPNYRPKLTSELDIYPTQGDRNNGLLHVTHNGWNTSNGGVTGESLSLRTAVTGFGHLPMESSYMNGGRLTGRMEDYYSYLAVRNVKFGQDPGNAEQWPRPAIELMARGPYVWMYTDQKRRTALLIATGAGGSAERVVAGLRWLADDATYAISDITLDDDGGHTYAYRGTFGGAELKRPGFPIDLAVNSSRGQAFWIRQVAGSALTLQYADEHVSAYRVDASSRRIRIWLTGEPNTTATVIVVDPKQDRGLLVPVELNGRGSGTAVVAAWQLAAPQRVVFTTLTTAPDRTAVEPGTSFQLAATFTVDDFGPVTDVALTATAPAGWSSSGDGAHAGELATGAELTANWTLTVPADAEYGYAEIPVTVTYQAGALKQILKTARVFVTPAGVDYVSDLPFVSATNGWGPVERDLANGGTNAGDGPPLRLRGMRYDKGLGVHAPSEVVIDLGGRYERFTAEVGVDDSRAASGLGTVTFEVLGDGVSLARTGVLTPRDPAYPIDVALNEVQTLTLRVSDAGDGNNNDHANWADAMLHLPE